MRLFLREESKGNIHGIKISCGAPIISHLMYADDLLIAGRANVIEAKSIDRILETCCNWSGQEVNYNKSHLFLSRKLSKDSKKSVKNVLRL